MGKAKQIARLDTAKSRQLTPKPEKPETNYKVLVKQWGERVRAEPPAIEAALGPNREASETFISYGPFAGQEDNRKRMSTNSARSSGIDDDLMERIIRIEKLTKRLLGK